MGEPDGSTSQKMVAVYLVLLFISSLGEVYFPDIMNINQLQAKANWMFVGAALGNICGVFVPSQPGQLTWKDVPARKALVPALFDGVSKVFLLGGIALSSAQIKAILYNSCIVFSALLSRLILGRILSAGQWLGVVVLLGGLLAKIDFTAKSGGDGDDGGAALVPIGMLFILIGCVLHSMQNVVSEYYILAHKFPPPKLCCLTGCFNLTLWLLLFAVGFIIPEKEGSNVFGHYTRDYINVSGFKITGELAPFSSGVAFIGFVLASAVHAIAFYNLMGSIGVVSCGVMKGLTTAGYVILSYVLLCDRENPKLAGWCMSWRTAISTVFCVIGVMIYSFNSQKKIEPPREESLGQSEDEMGTIMGTATRGAIEEEMGSIMGTPLEHKDLFTRTSWKRMIS